ncbi:hypothetical protein ACTHPH_24765 [Paenibacillus pasadenensis]|uniref:Uncharacterized protein n=1 Tax=Paenibacillus pasadenensis TaxID=217090 RepID=A0A2N5N689_9BACL|nr:MULTISPECIES: hypothetical protein [Paenibacillus]PLT45809.1 hypothetical protein B8V81_4240 [Paenibacillus pasadenensis]QGG56243.1 hypothetical protein GE073_12075 [Paenibacillus sp. B01]
MDKRMTMAAMLQGYAWALAATGAVLCLFFLTPFNDRNLPLMLGMGCLVASPVVMIAASMFPLSEEIAEDGQDKTIR